jgi:hypothetical protein
MTRLAINSLNLARLFSGLEGSFFGTLLTAEFAIVTS